MLDIVTITPEFSIGPQISPEDIEQLRAAGFISVLNARPDDELGTYMLSTEAEKLVREAGMSYAFCPTEGHEIFEVEITDTFETLLADLPKPIFAHCKTGTRAAILWALVAARHREIEDVISTLRAAGQELDFLEQELRDSAEAAQGQPFRLKNDALMNLGKSSLLGNSSERPDET